MTHTTDPTAEAVTRAKHDTERRSARLLHLFSFVPDDRLTWAPSPTAKSSLRVVAHCGLICRFMADAITGGLPDPIPSAAEFLQNLSASEETIPTREAAVALVQAATAELCRALDTVNDANIDSTPGSPFGAVPMRFWMTHGADQMAGHAGQLEYLQTLWGDLDNHLG